MSPGHFTFSQQRKRVQEGLRRRAGPHSLKRGTRYRFENIDSWAPFWEDAGVPPGLKSGSLR
jgi:hypothetical protein